MGGIGMTYFWYDRKNPVPDKNGMMGSRNPERHNQPCRLLKKGRRMNTILIQFSDGHKMTTSFNFIHKAAL